MPKVRATALTGYFCAPHSQAVIHMFFDVSAASWPIKTGPATSGIEFCAGVKEGVATACTAILTLFPVIPILAGEGSFRAFFPADMKLLSGQLVTPLSIAFSVIIHTLFPIDSPAKTVICSLSAETSAQPCFDEFGAAFLIKSGAVFSHVHPKTAMAEVSSIAIFQNLFHKWNAQLALRFQGIPVKLI